MSILCELCGARTEYEDTLCKNCMAMYNRDMAAKRFPPPITDGRDFRLSDWIEVRKMEASLTKAGKSREEIRQAVYDYAACCKESYERARRCNEERNRKQQSAQADMDARYTY